VGFKKDQLELCRGALVPDLIGPDCKLLFVGINPGLWTAATGVHFAHPSNRFYPALLEAGIIRTAVDIDPPHPAVVVPSRSSDPSVLGRGQLELIERGLGITNLVARATARASEFSAREVREGAARLDETVTLHDPTVVAIAGITAYRAAFGRRNAVPGRQVEPIAGSEVWVVPNPSGLNAHETVATLAAQYRTVALRAGVVDG
jgi:TDG/mug DNA glycosylase family protein